MDAELESPGRRWWVLLPPVQLPRRLRSVSSGVARLSNDYCGKGWRRPSSLHHRSRGYEDLRDLACLRVLPCECAVWRRVVIQGTKVAPLGSLLPVVVTGGQVVVVVDLGVIVIVVVVSFRPNFQLLPAESWQTGRRA